MRVVVGEIRMVEEEQAFQLRSVEEEESVGLHELVVKEEQVS